MKKFFLFLFILVFPISSFAAEKVIAKKLLGNNFTIEQTDSKTFIKYKGKLLKTYTNDYSVKNPFVYDEGCLSLTQKLDSTQGDLQTKKQQVWEGLGKNGQRACIRENLRNSLTIETTSFARFFILAEAKYESVNSNIFDTKTLKLFPIPSQTSLFSILTGKSGIFFRTKSGYDCGDNIFFLSNVGKFSKIFNPCDRGNISAGEYGTLDNFELLYGGKVQVDYTLTSNQGPVHKSEVIVIPTSVTQTFENDYMKLSAPSGWKISPVNKTSNVGTCVNKTNCTYKTKTEVDPSAVNITKGNYILYINTRAKQTSGIIGGRLGEILIGAPSFGAVIKDYSSANSCANLIEGNGTINNPNLDGHRMDLFVTSQADKNICNTASSGKNVWFASYITSDGSYFLHTTDMQAPNGYVITMSYNSKNINKLPIKGSVELSTALTEMTDIIATLQLK